MDIVELQQLVVASATIVRLLEELVELTERFKRQRIVISRINLPREVPDEPEEVQP